MYLKIVFILANSTDPDEMPPYVAFHLDLHCFRQSTGLLVSRIKRVLGKNEFVHYSMRNDKDILYKLL